MNKDFYNKSSATQLGWDPTWFGEKHYDDKLVRAIKKFQKQYYGQKKEGFRQSPEIIMIIPAEPSAISDFL